MKAKANQKKQDIVKKVEGLAKKYPIIATVDMENLPTPQLQGIREKLRGTMEIFVAKKRLIKLGFDNVLKDKPGIDKLTASMRGMPGLIFTNENPFKLFKVLKQNKTQAPAKAGQHAPNDIEIKAGTTPFAPGPIIGELGMLGLQTGVEGGKVAIKKTKVVAKEGDVITPHLAGILTRLDIKPMEVGLNLVAVFENGTIIDKSVLDIDVDQYIADLGLAHNQAINLGVEASIFNKTTVEILLGKANRQAVNLVLNEGIIVKDKIKEVIGSANMKALSLKSGLKI